MKYLDDLAAVEADARVIAVIVGQKEIILPIDDGRVAVAVMAVIFNKEHPLLGKCFAPVIADGTDIWCSAPGFMGGTAVIVRLRVEDSHCIIAYILHQHGGSGGREEVVRAGDAPGETIVFRETLELAAKAGANIAPQLAVVILVKTRLLVTDPVGGEGHCQFLSSAPGASLPESLHNPWREAA